MDKGVYYRVEKKRLKSREDGGRGSEGGRRSFGGGGVGFNFFFFVWILVLFLGIGV